MALSLFGVANELASDETTFPLRFDRRCGLLTCRSEMGR